MQQVALNLRELPYDVNEAMKLLRTNLQFCGKDKKVILITSTFADEGKSTVALNLCRSLAQLGSRVILVDADMRKSVMAERLIKGEKNMPGLSHLLSARSSLEEVLMETDVENLNIIMAGRVPPNPAELLSNARMIRLIDICRNEYDYVIVDCPPINLNMTDKKNDKYYYKKGYYKKYYGSYYGDYEKKDRKSSRRKSAGAH